MQRFFRKDRAVMFELAGRLKFEATSTDRSVLDALDWALQHWTLARDHIPDHYEVDFGGEQPAAA